MSKEENASRDESDLTKKYRLFISWSGTQSLRVAELMKRYVETLVPNLETFFSPEDVRAGSRWADDLIRELGTTTVGLILLNKENQHQPWIQYEAGAISKVSDQGSGRPLTLLLNGMKPADVEGPLALFQHKTFDKEGVTDVLIALAEISKSDQKTDNLKKVMDQLWPAIEQDYSLILAESGQIAEVPERPVADKVDEILSRVRAISTSRSFELYKARKDFIEDQYHSTLIGKTSVGFTAGEYTISLAVADARKLAELVGEFGLKFEERTLANRPELLNYLKSEGVFIPLEGGIISVNPTFASAIQIPLPDESPTPD